MRKTVSTRDAQNKLSALIGWAKEHEEGVIVENRGEPTAAIISFAEYERLCHLKEQERRRGLLEEMRQIQARVSARNTDLSETEVDRLADDITREAMESLIAHGKVRFEERAAS